MVRNVLLLGGSGFVGTSVANRLSAAGVNVTIASRRRERGKANIMLPQVEVVEAGDYSAATLERLLAGKDAVINLVGVLHDRDSRLPYGHGFAAAHVELPKRLLAAMRQSGVRRLLHMSALGADPHGGSEYLRSKGDGEALVLAAADELDVTVFKPSVIFGPGDRFLNTFARIFRLAPSFSAGGLRARLQPVYVGDVADALVSAIERRDTFGMSYQLGGPKIYTLREIVEYVRDLGGFHGKKIKELSDFMAYLQAGLLWLLPNPPLSPDNLRTLEKDSVVSTNRRPYPGWNPTPLEAIAPTYIAKASPRGRLDDFRCQAGRQG